MKKIILFSLALSILLSLTGCYNDDDWAPYESYTKTIKSILTVEITKISDIIPDIDKIAQHQQNDLVLTNITMIFEGERAIQEKSGTIIFGYAKPHSKINQVSKMDIYFNMSNKTVEKFDWEKGHGKRVSCITDSIGDKYTSISLSEIFVCFENDSKYTNNIADISPRLKIELSFNKLDVFLYDANKTYAAPVFVYSSETNNPA